MEQASARIGPPRTLAPPTAADALSVGSHLGFGLGMIGDRIFRDAPALLLLVFMTNYLAIPPALAGVAIFIPKTADHVRRSHGRHPVGPVETRAGADGGR